MKNLSVAPVPEADGSDMSYMGRRAVVYQHGLLTEERKRTRPGGTLVTRGWGGDRSLRTLLSDC